MTASLTGDPAELGRYQMDGVRPAIEQATTAGGVLAPLIIQRVFDSNVEIGHHGTTGPLVEQNPAMALSVAGRGYVFETGRTVTSGRAADLSENETVEGASLGLRAS